MNTASDQHLGLASRKRRIAAFLIDHVIITLSIVTIIFLALGADFTGGDSMSKLPMTMLAVMLPGFLVYFAKDSINGISIGKWVMGIRVRDEENPEVVPSFARLFIRNFFLIIWPVEFLILASNDDKKRLGDRTARTVVVKNPNELTKLPRILLLAGVGISFFIFVFLFAGTAMKSSGAYKTAIAEIEQNQEILQKTGGIKGYGMMPAGSVSISNGNGQAQLQITVLGMENDINVSVYLTKEANGAWELIELNL